MAGRRHGEGEDDSRADVASSGRVADDLDDALGQLVLDYELHHRLRQEPRFEHPTAILVGDTPLPTMTDSLNNCYADVPCLLLYGVTHRLHTITEHHGLYQHHLISSSPPPGRDHKKTPRISRIRGVGAWSAAHGGGHEARRL